MAWTVASPAAMWSGCEAAIRSQLRTGDMVITRWGRTWRITREMSRRRSWLTVSSPSR